MDIHQIAGERCDEKGQATFVPNCDTDDSHRLGLCKISRTRKSLALRQRFCDGSFWCDQFCSAILRRGCSAGECEKTRTAGDNEACNSVHNSTGRQPWTYSLPISAGNRASSTKRLSGWFRFRKRFHASAV